VKYITMAGLGCFIACAGLLSAQPKVPAQVTVPPGTQREIVLQVPAPQSWDVIDILTGTGNANLRISIVLPDGTEVAESNAEQLEIAWKTIPEQELNEAGDSVKRSLLSGPGPHTFVSFREKPLGGNYRIRFDARQAATPSRVAAMHIPISSLLMPELRAIPGIKITKTVRAPAGSAETRLSLALTAGTEDAVLDVALTDPRVDVSLRYPDGTVVNRQNAKANGVTWEISKWPPTGFDGDLGDIFGALFQTAMMLLVDGTHHLIFFEGGVRKSGRYTIQVNARGASRVSEVSAMFRPLGSLLKELDNEPANPPLRSGETMAVAYGAGSGHYALDKIDLTIGLRGAPLSEPAEFRSRATLKPPGREQAKAVDVQIDFTRGAGGLYHGVFIPSAGGLYQITTEVRGIQESGQPFSGETSPIDILIFPLAAKLNGLTERAVDTAGKGRPDRLDVTAHIDVLEAGEYRLDLELQENGGQALYKSVKATVGLGPQEITASFSGLEIYQHMKLDGPYQISVRNLTSLNTSGGGDVRNGSKITTAAYRREDWDRGPFYGTAKISGAGVDTKGNGKFQIYRVSWDVVTPGGDCLWWGTFSPIGAEGSFFAGERKRLAPGPATLEFDTDGYTIAKAGGEHVWKMSVHRVQCDGESMPGPEHVSSLIDLNTGILRAADFEAIPAECRIQPESADVKLLAGGTHKVVPVRIVRIGRFTEPIKLRLSGVPGHNQDVGGKCRRAALDLHKVLRRHFDSTGRVSDPRCGKWWERRARIRSAAARRSSGRFCLVAAGVRPWGHAAGCPAECSPCFGSERNHERARVLRGKAVREEVQKGPAAWRGFTGNGGIRHAGRRRAAADRRFQSGLPKGDRGIRSSRVLWVVEHRLCA
jgi:hypothetical protein